MISGKSETNVLPLKPPLQSKTNDSLSISYENNMRLETNSLRCLTKNRGSNICLKSHIQVRQKAKVTCRVAHFRHLGEK